MLEIIIIFVLVIVAFAAAVWFAMYRTRKQSLEIVAETIARVEPELDDDNAFSSVLKQEMTEHNIDEQSAIVDDATVTISTEAQQTAVEHVEESRQGEIDLRVDDGFDIDVNAVTDTTSGDHDEPAISLVNDWDMVIAFTIIADEDMRFTGSDLQVALASEQFHHGEFNIFHRLTSGAHKKPLFSVANILDPGTFDFSDIESMNTPGILVFAKLPGPVNGLTLFDDLLETARALAKKLSGVLCDEARQPLTEQTIETQRGRILNLNLSMHTDMKSQTHAYTD